MELIEPIESINQRLIDYFGTDVITGLPIWRVVFANDQYEKVLVNENNGIVFITPQVVERKKYMEEQDRYILERLVIVPEQQQRELLGSKINYEPMWKFVDKYGRYLPPKFEFCKLVVDTIYAALGKSSLASYVEDPDDPEVKRKRLDSYHDYLFADETDISDAFAVGDAVALPSKHFGEE